MPSVISGNEFEDGILRLNSPALIVMTRFVLTNECLSAEDVKENYTKHKRTFPAEGVMILSCTFDYYFHGLWNKNFLHF